MSWKYIALDGGGAKGIAEVGALSVLHERGILKEIKGFAGSSAGAIIAGFLACGATTDWLYEKIHALDFKKFADDSWGFIQDAYRLFWKKGWHEGNALCTEYRNLLSELGCDPDITLGEIHKKFSKELKITVTKIFKRNGVSSAKTVFLHHSTHPNMELWRAVRMSASFPYYFQTVPFEGGDATDGGVLMNYPICAFDTDGLASPLTIGLKLISNDDLGRTSDIEEEDDEKDVDDAENTESVDRARGADNDAGNISVSDASGVIEPTHDIKDFTLAVIDSLYTAAQQRHEHTADWLRTIPILTGEVSAMDMNLSDDQKNTLYLSGRIAAKEFLDSGFIKKMSKISQ